MRNKEVEEMETLARRVFVSYRFSDGASYKNELCRLFDREDDVIDCSEDTNRSDLSEESIKNYLYKKLKHSSVTIVLLTPNAVEYGRSIWTARIDDWLYDEIRYSLDDREDNRMNGIVAVYTTEAQKKIITKTLHRCNVCNKESELPAILDFENLARKNMLNVKKQYKQNCCEGVYDDLEDSYVSLVSYEAFTSDIDKYIENAASKRERYEEFILTKRL